MASSFLTAKVKCSTCLNITDHLVLKCGHNICQNCNDCVLNPQDRSGTYSCPQCSENIKKCPFLLKNRFHSIMKNFRTPQPDPEKKDCTNCLHPHVPAVKCCLHCAVYLCNDHLKVHGKSPEHVLCDPNISLENRRCRDHKEERLKFYCIEDADCICVTCRLDGDHQGHQVESLEVASKKKKQKLNNVLPKLMIKQEEMEKRVLSLQEHSRTVQGKAANETKRVTALFTDLRRRLEDLEKRVVSDISGQVERVSIFVLGAIQQLERKKIELSRKMHHIEELCNMTDPLTVLQESETSDLCDTEDRDDEDRKGHDKLLHGGWDLDVAEISHTLHSGISDIMSGINVQKYPGTHVYPHSSTKDKIPISVELLRSFTQPKPTVQPLHRQAGGLNIAAIQQTSEEWGATDILLDVSTAGNYLRMSDDKKTASWSGISHNRPDSSNRFKDYPQVLSGQCFSSGRHYWQVDVEGSRDWIVGVCYPSIDRTGEQSGIGYNKKSWGLERWDNQYSVIHDSDKIRLPGNVSSNRVRIDLDYTPGRISFYGVCDSIQRLYTFTTTFTEPLHAVLGVGDGCIEIAGGNQKVRNPSRD